MMRSIRTEKIRQTFIDALGACGSVTQAAAAAGLSRDALYRWRVADGDFAEEWERALELGTEALEDEARRRAFAGSDQLLMFLLKGLRPHRYRERSQVDLNTCVSADIRRTPLAELKAELADLIARAASDPAVPARVVAPARLNQPRSSADEVDAVAAAPGENN